MKILDVDDETHRRVKILSATIGLKMNDLSSILINHAIDEWEREKRIERLAEAVAIVTGKESK